VERLRAPDENRNSHRTSAYSKRAIGLRSINSLIANGQH
jgi:hypothetical protein